MLEFLIGIVIVAAVPIAFATTVLLAIVSNWSRHGMWTATAMLAAVPLTWLLRTHLRIVRSEVPLTRVDGRPTTDVSGRDPAPPPSRGDRGYPPPHERAAVVHEGVRGARRGGGAANGPSGPAVGIGRAASDVAPGADGSMRSPRSRGCHTKVSDRLATRVPSAESPFHCG